MSEAQRVVDTLLEFMDEHPLPEPPGGPERHHVRLPNADPDHDVMISVLKELYPEGVPPDVATEIMGPEIGPDELPGEEPPPRPRF